MIANLGTRAAVRGSGAGVFDPTTTGKCALWLDFGDSGNRTIASGQFTHVLDKSGNGYDFTQTGSTTIRPALATVAGYECAQFDGTNDYMENTNLNISTVYDVWLVVSFSSFSAGQPLHIFDFYRHVSGTGTGRGLYSRSLNDGTADPREAIIDYNDGGGGSVQLRSQGAAYALTNTIYSTHFIPGVSNSAIVYVDDVNVTNATWDTTPANAPAISDGTNKSKIGATRNLSAYGKSNVYEIIAFDSALTAGETTNMRTYINNKRP